MGKRYLQGRANDEYDAVGCRDISNVTLGLVSLHHRVQGHGGTCFAGRTDESMEASTKGQEIEVDWATLVCKTNQLEYLYCNVPDRWRVLSLRPDLKGSGLRQQRKKKAEQ